MDYINIYRGNPTAGSTDGEVVTDSNKIITTVRTTGEEKYQTIAIRCETGYITEGDTILEVTGANKNAWAFEYNGLKGEYGTPISISDVIEDKNVLVKLYSKALPDEIPCIDTSAVIKLKTAIATV